MDDDFSLTAYTKLDELLKVIEESGYDLIGGPVETPNMNTLRQNPWADYIDYDRFQIGRSPDGFCYFRGKVPIAPLTNFPNCEVRDIIKNYFIARTSTAGRVRMDPHVTRSGHKEFFVDALGELRIARFPIFSLNFSIFNSLAATLRQCSIILKVVPDERKITRNSAIKRDPEIQRNSIDFKLTSFGTTEATYAATQRNFHQRSKILCYEQIVYLIQKKNISNSNSTSFHFAIFPTVVSFQISSLAFRRSVRAMKKERNF